MLFYYCIIMVDVFLNIEIFGARDMKLDFGKSIMVLAYLGRSGSSLDCLIFPRLLKLSFHLVYLVLVSIDPCSTRSGWMCKQN